MTPREPRRAPETRSARRQRGDAARRWLGALLTLVLGCGEADDEEATSLVLDFDTQPTCAAADATCLNDGTSTFSVEGIRVIHKPLVNHPLVSFRISFDAAVGSSRQRWAEALALGLYALGGPRRLSSAAWNDELLRLGGAVSTSSGLDYGTISATVPAFNWRELWELVIEGIVDYRKSDRELGNRIGLYQRSLESEFDDPDSAASIDTWARLFQDHAYNYQRERADLLATMSALDIDGAWSALYARERWLVTVVGDVSADDVGDALADAARAVGQPGNTPAFDPDPAIVPETNPEIRLLPYPEAPTWHLTGYFRGPSAASPDLALLELGLAVLDRRLFNEVRDARGLAYTTGASLSFYRETFGQVWLTSESPLEALPVSRQVIADLKATGPTPAELAAARSSLMTRLLAGSDTPSGMAATIADWELTAGSREALDDYLAALERATPEEVASRLDTYLRDLEIGGGGGGSALSTNDLESWFVSP